jgi:hypothetical protein
MEREACGGSGLAAGAGGSRDARSSAVGMMDSLPAASWRLQWRDYSKHRLHAAAVGNSSYVTMHSPSCSGYVRQTVPKSSEASRPGRQSPQRGSTTSGFQLPGRSG